MKLHVPRIMPNQIYRYRSRQRLTVDELLDISGIGRNTYYRWGRSSCPNLLSALKLSAVLECPVEVIFLEYFQYIQSHVKKRQLKHNLRKLKADVNHRPRVLPVDE